MAISLPKGKKAWLVFGLGGGLVLVVITVERRKKAAAASSAATDGSTGQIDPLTGDVAGSAQDQYDLAQLQSEGQFGAAGFYPSSGYGVTGPPAGSSIPGAGGFATNGEWMQQAETDLGGFGVDETALAAALGKYLAGAAVTPDQAALIDQAIAAEGYPPVQGTSGYPPNIKDLGSGGGGGGGGSVTLPNVVGERAETAASKLKALGLKPLVKPGTPHGKTGHITAMSPAAGTSVAAGSTVTLTNKIT